jgi:plasmid replication initiation protein
MENNLLCKETRIIKKSNRLIQNVVNHCSYYQNKLLFVLLDKYGKKISDSKCDEITITVKELCDMLGYDYHSGNFDKNIVRALTDFRKCGIDIASTDENGNLKYIGLNFFKKITVEDNICSFEWNDILAKNGLLGELTERYYQLGDDYLNLRSSYSQILYELFMSYKNYERRYNKQVEVSVESLKRTLNIENTKTYNNFSDFNKLLLKKSINEINISTSLEVTYRTKRKGRKIDSILFTINDNNIIDVNAAEIGAEILKYVDLKEIYNIAFDGEPLAKDLVTLKNLILTYDYSSILYICKHAYYNNAQSMSYIVSACSNDLEKGKITDRKSDNFIDPTIDRHDQITALLEETQKDYGLDAFQDVFSEIDKAYKYYTHWEIIYALRDIEAYLEKITPDKIHDRLKNIVKIKKECI